MGEIRGAGGGRRARRRLRLAGVAAALAVSAAMSVALAANAFGLFRTRAAPGRSVDAAAGVPADAVLADDEARVAPGAPSDQAQPGDRHLADGAARSAHELSTEQAVALAQRRYRARVVRAERRQGPDGRPVYELRLLSARGVVWTVRIDAYSGAEIP